MINSSILIQNNIVLSGAFGLRYEKKMDLLINKRGPSIQDASLII